LVKRPSSSRGAPSNGDAEKSANTNAMFADMNNPPTHNPSHKFLRNNANILTIEQLHSNFNLAP
jgi:hypothetical protein